MLRRTLSLWAVVALALCSVIGGGINVLIVEVQQETHVGDIVPFIIIFNGIIALIISLVYASLASAMPEVGGEYLYIRKGISEAVAFSVGFVKWAGVVVAIGTLAYMNSLIAASLLSSIGFEDIASFLRSPVGASIFSVAVIVFFWLIEDRGGEVLGKTALILAAIMIIGGLIITYVNFINEKIPYPGPEPRNDLATLIYVSAVLFWAYVGFTSVTQSGSELKEAKKNLPRALLLTSLFVTIYYFLYSLAFYHSVDWREMADKGGAVTDYIQRFLPPWISFPLIFSVFVSLANGVFSMLYTTSRLLYRWALDGIVPRWFLKVNEFGSPSNALATVSVISILVSIFSAFGGLFTEVDVVVFSRFILYSLVAFSLINLPKRRPYIYKKISFLKDRRLQLILSFFVIVFSIILGIVAGMEELKKSLLGNAVVQTLLFIILGFALWKFSRRKRKRSYE